MTRTPFLDDDPRHGTPAGRQAHIAHDTSACEPCAVAWKFYTRDRRMKKASQTRYAFPVAMTLPAYDFEGVGIAIARAIRELA